ncbi:hypothetical protein [Ralstonia insidiosa]|jgi:hypothetical protein|nr:hypothetical protein [Ralstonia insidiosa]MBA9939257.1 hypothetical protein [Ralstonia insidiosa]MBC9968029.1 hypothetical protein [Ralstonia insidiosa]MBX3904408.1 hypothetical protein [Ralstonia insidiosa]
MREFAIDRGVRLQSSSRVSEDFESAVQEVAERVGAHQVNLSRVSSFRTHYAAVLDRIKDGSVEVINKGGEPFLLLGATQLFALLKNEARTLTTAEVLQGLPSVSLEGGAPPRARAVGSKSHHRVPR